jgi:lipopolysaccharide export system permease protein
LFFVGAPLGAIIRKGGLGLPVVMSILFFIPYHILSMTGERAV